MTDEHPENTGPDRWTDEAKDSFVRAAEALTSALRTHTVAVAAAGSDADVATISAAKDALAVALEAYDEAQYDYSGTFPPFAIIEEDVDDEHDHAHDDDSDAAPLLDEAITGVTILQRTDYRITDPQAVLAAGIVAQRAAPDEIEGPVNDLGAALYALAHGSGPGGWSRLGDTSGVDPVAQVTLAVANEGLLPGDPDEWPEDSLSVEEGELIFQEGATWVD
ncbi:hypothetical protein FE697_002960 [Mumia zhuanghuii]|uniref:Uncharacterized protein n=2 Tax=Mumia TaxID=1546255 RepID=A0ABW1QNR2_9ACTN|nr:MULTISPECIES: hypothetical protein [Mumia]KAA1424883.1 hypothetical protein FE697_002960 [Mumia zhuanghuii]